MSKLKRNAMTIMTGGLISLSVFAHEGSGLRGGSGHVVDVDSTPYLMDLVTKAVCEWKEGEEFFAELPTLNMTLDKLAQVDWYFAHSLKNEIYNLNYCMTGPLYRRSTGDSFGSAVSTPTRENVRQAGVRFRGQVFLDASIFKAMNEANRSMLLIHEAMHSYFPMNLFDRALKLRSMVKVIDQVRTGQIRLRRKLHYAMKNNEVDFPTTVGTLDLDKDAVKFLLGTPDYQVKAIMQSQRPEELMQLDPETMGALAYWDVKFIKSRSARTIFEDALAHALLVATDEEFVELIENKDYEVVGPIIVALSVLPELSKVKQDIVFSSTEIKNWITKGLKEVSEAELKYSGFLVMASAGFQALTSTPGAPNGEAPLLQLLPAKELPARLAWLPSLMVTLNKEGMLKLVTDNALFYKALGLHGQRALVEGMTMRIPREKQVALTRLDMISEALVSTLLKSLVDITKSEELEEIKKQIKFERF